MRRGEHLQDGELAWVEGQRGEEDEAQEEAEEGAQVAAGKHEDAVPATD